MSLAVRYNSAGTAGQVSPNIWGDCPVEKSLIAPDELTYMYDSFLNNFTANEVILGNWLVVGTNPDTAIVTDEADGVINISGSGAEHDEAYICSNLLCDEVIKKNSNKRLWFEASIKVLDGDADASIICGLGEASLLAADAIADDPTSYPTTALADYDFIGFMAGTDGTNMGGIDSVYHQDGDSGTVTVVQADVVTNTAGTTTNDDVYKKLGFKFDGKSTVTFYVDGVAQTTTLDVDDLTGNKLDDALGIIIGIKDDTGGADDLQLDWVRFACDKVACGC
ncbi:MAG: hypothetical protein JRE28_10390 [Deltaproteobacteria bacterium]|nr:hypothetical protein [Deltaproteobacteria bacterium]